MIEFKGSTTGSGRIYASQCNSKVTMFSVVALTLVTAVAILINLLKWNVIILPFLAPFMIYFFLIAFKGSNSFLLVPESIEIDENYIQIKSVSFNGKKRTNSVKQVIDKGDFYCIYFMKLPLYPNLVCQKSLIKEGTIQQFEEMFKDKIKK